MRRRRARAARRCSRPAAARWTQPTSCAATARASSVSYRPRARIQRRPPRQPTALTPTVHFAPKPRGRARPAGPGVRTAARLRNGAAASDARPRDRQLSRPPAREARPPLLDALRIGTYQLLFMDSVPDTPRLRRRSSWRRPPRRGLQVANAVLRRATREARGHPDGGQRLDPAGAAVRHSHPQWLAELWWKRLGREDTLALLAADNESAEDALRVNTLVTEPDVIRQTPGLPQRRRDPGGVVLDGPFDVEGSPSCSQAAPSPRSRGASMLVARTLDPEPGERILDMCAAPGTKTTHAAALTRNEGRSRQSSRTRPAPTSFAQTASGCRHDPST